MLSEQLAVVVTCSGLESISKQLRLAGAWGISEQIWALQRAYKWRGPWQSAQSGSSPT